MPASWIEGASRPTDLLLTSGGKSEVSAGVILGAYCFPTTDSRDDVGFLGSLPLAPRTKSKPVTPLSAAPAGTDPQDYLLERVTVTRHSTPSTRQDAGRTTSSVR